MRSPKNRGGINKKYNECVGRFVVFLRSSLMSRSRAQHGFPVLLDVDVAHGRDLGSLGNVGVVLLDDLNTDGLDDALWPGLHVERFSWAHDALGLQLVLLVQLFLTHRCVKAYSPWSLNYQRAISLVLPDGGAARSRPGMTRQLGDVGRCP